MWDAATGQPLVTLIGHTNGVQSIVFSPDGTRLATASWDWTAKLWNATTGQELLTLSSHTNAVNGIAFSPDGTRLATASADDTARMYVLPIEQLMALARTRLTRTWTPDECKEYLQADTCPPTP